MSATSALADSPGKRSLAALVRPRPGAVVQPHGVRQWQSRMVRAPLRCQPSYRRPSLPKESAKTHVIRTDDDRRSLSRSLCLLARRHKATSWPAALGVHCRSGRGGGRGGRGGRAGRVGQGGRSGVDLRGRRTRSLVLFTVGRGLTGVGRGRGRVFGAVERSVLAVGVGRVSCCGNTLPHRLAGESVVARPRPRRRRQRGKLNLRESS